MDQPFYPINSMEPAMKGLVIGALGIFHVFTAQFAIGGGMLGCYFQWLGRDGRRPHLRVFIDNYFKTLVLISFVIGAVTGVAMWFTSIQVGARTIGMMVDYFHWIWAIEWTFFCLEVVAGYAFYRYGPRLTDRARLALLTLYTLAAWASLFWINGILSWQLTPGAWLESKNVWDGFFNPTFWPSLVFRTITSMTVAALIACVLVNLIRDLDRERRAELIQQASHFLIPLLLLPPVALWYFLAIPEQGRQWVSGGSVAMTMFATLAAGCTAMIAAYALFGLVYKKAYVSGFTAALLCTLAFLASAGGEFVREGVRKPFTISRVLYSNSILPEQVAEFRKTGSVTNDPYPLRDGVRYANEQLQLGAKVFRFQCDACHTVRGTNGLVHLAGTWSETQKRMNIAQLQRTKSFMPPFAGTPEELEAIVQWITWQHAGRPVEWPESNDPAALQQIRQWLLEAGTEPGIVSHRGPTHGERN